MKIWSTGCGPGKNCSGGRARGGGLRRDGLSVGLASPEPVASAALGPERCSRIAFVLTTCTRIEQAERAALRVRKEAKEADCLPGRRLPSANHFGRGNATAA
jgi:hypothetical protein